jgi:hypothetical protein
MQENAFVIRDNLPKWYISMELFTLQALKTHLIPAHLDFKNLTHIALKILNSAL